MRPLRALLLALPLALGSCSNTTGGSLLTVPFRAGGLARDAAGPLTVTSATNWEVTLDQAKVALGPFYFNVSSPPTDQFRGGVVIVEVTRQAVVDVLDPALQDIPGGGDGQTGRAVSVEIGLLAPDAQASASDASLLENGFAYLSGTARRGAEVVPFEGRLVIDKRLATAAQPLEDLQRIKGASVDLTFTAAPQVLELRVDPSHWFDLVDFASLEPASPDGGAAPSGQPVTWSTTSAFHSQLLQGVKAEGGAYLFSLRKQ